MIVSVAYICSPNKLMKNLNLLINIILAVAVTVLFALHFNSGKSSGASNADLPSVSSGNLKFAFVDADSLTENYLMYKDESEAASQRTLEAEEKFSAKQKKFEKDANEFQQRAQYLTITERESREAKLVQQQQELMRLEQELAGELQRMEADVSRRIFDTIDVFLKDYAKANGLSFVLTYAKGGGIWFADPVFDITPQVLTELNARYEKQKAE
jgi:outer membrane protein